MARSPEHIQRMGRLSEDYASRLEALNQEWSKKRRNLMLDLGPVCGNGTVVELPGKLGRVLYSELPEEEGRHLTYRYRVEYKRGESWAEIWVSEEDLVIHHRQTGVLQPRHKAVPKRDKVVVTQRDISNLDELLKDLGL